MSDTRQFSIGQNVGSVDFTDTATYSGGGGGSIWNTIFSDTLPQLFNFGGQTWVGIQNAKAQQIAAENRNRWFQNPFGSFGGNTVPGANGRNNNVFIIIAVVVAIIVFALIFKRS